MESTKPKRISVAERFRKQMDYSPEIRDQFQGIYIFR